MTRKCFWINNFGSDCFDVWEYPHPVVYLLLKKIVKSTVAFWSSNLFLSIKSSTAEDFAFVVGSTDCIIFHADLGLSFLVSNNVAKCFFDNAIDIVNLFENL